ncbi:unnamed protein product, partial [Staurois parvus]
MRRCSGGPCSTYLVLRSRDVSPAASPASPPADASIRLLCSSPREVGTYGRRPAVGNLKKNLKNVFFFFFFNFQYALSCALPAFCLLFL